MVKKEWIAVAQFAIYTLPFGRSFGSVDERRSRIPNTFKTWIVFVGFAVSAQGWQENSRRANHAHLNEWEKSTASHHTICLTRQVVDLGPPLLDATKSMPGVGRLGPGTLPFGARTAKQKISSNAKRDPWFRGQ
ncbi:hypothetical protein AOQ84DRAFT_69555 [Glonium stellatum]|uniref:Uncharacterized protein n=1 Tax=Glonium stellatum TaxID=574774 RepID=A0A8E2FBR2_9PEZI|nr:hypothetical protein AOQ84DRAFT_69555 [Glonium stellatum]